MNIQKFSQTNPTTFRLPVKGHQKPDSHLVDGVSPMKLSQQAQDNLITGVGSVALFGGLGAGVGALFGSPGVGALKGLGVMGVMLVSSEVMDNPWVEKNVFGWSEQCMSAQDDPNGLKSKVLFGANLATNAAVLAGVGASIGAVIAGGTGAAIGAGGIFVVGLLGLPLL